VKTNLPAIRYDLFIKAFEKKVTAAQAAIEALRVMEQPYNVVKDAMESARLPNDQHMNMDARSIGVMLHATQADSLEALETLAQTIGQRLFAAGMHHDGDPATSHGGSSCCLWFAWNCNTERAGSFQVRLYVSVPTAGLRDCEVIKSERQTVETDFQLKRIEPPRHAAPEHLSRTQSDGLDVVRAALDDDETAF
jgi:hypothetical protein